MTINVEKSVFLLDTEPWLLCTACFGSLSAGAALVGDMGQFIASIRLAHDQLVESAQEGVFEYGHRVEIHIGVLPNSLTS